MNYKRNFWQKSVLQSLERNGKWHKMSISCSQHTHTHTSSSNLVISVHQQQCKANVYLIDVNEHVAFTYSFELWRIEANLQVSMFHTSSFTVWLLKFSKPTSCVATMKGNMLSNFLIGNRHLITSTMNVPSRNGNLITNILARYFHLEELIWPTKQ